MESQQGGDQLSHEEALNQLPKKNLQLMISTIEGINSAMEIKSILKESLEAARLVMNSEASSLMLLDRETGELHVSIPTGPVKGDIEGKVIPEKRGIAGWVVENKRPYLTNDVDSSEHFWGDLSREFTTRNLICVPLINRSNEVIGVMQAINRRKNEEFTTRDIPVFQALSSHVTAALERAQKLEKLHDRIKEQQSQIEEINLRVKKSLDALTEYIENQLADRGGEEAGEVLKEILEQIRSMSGMQEMLFEAGMTGEIFLDRYLEQLIGKIEEILKAMHVDLSVIFRGEPVKIRSHNAYLFGLILSELLTHLYRQALLSGEGEGAIYLDLNSLENEVRLAVSDRGFELAGSLKSGRKRSFDLWFVDNMLEKLGGRIETKPENEAGPATGTESVSETEPAGEAEPGGDSEPAGESKPADGSGSRDSSETAPERGAVKERNERFTLILPL